MKNNSYTDLQFSIDYIENNNKRERCIKSGEVIHKSVYDPFFKWCEAVTVYCSVNIKKRDTRLTVKLH